MAKSVVFGDYSFKTKKSVIDYVQSVIGKYSFKECMNEEDVEFFLSLFTLHDEYKEKLGVGVSKLRVDRDFHGNRCICILRIDGSEEGISWRHCINPLSVRSNVSNAFRRAVKETVISFRDNALFRGENICEYLNVTLDKSNSNVSYRGVSFESLLDDFLFENNIDYCSIDLLDPPASDHDQRAILSDPNLTEEWRNYHSKYAELVLVSKMATMRRLVS